METTSIYIAIFVTSALVLLLIGIVIAYLRLVQKVIALKEERKKESGLETVEKAQVTAQKMIEDARVKAQQVINNAQVFSKAQSDVLEKEIQNANRLNTQKYEESLKMVQNESIKLLSTMPKDISEAVKMQLVNVKVDIQKEIESAAGVAKQQLETAYKRAEMEVQSYKMQRLKQIDDSIINILEEVSRNVLAKQISHEEHEKLVMKALDEAKEKHVFSLQEEEAVVSSQ